MTHHPFPTARTRTAALLATAGLAAAALAPSTALADTVVVAKGAGFGHGIGMSQWGAYGQAKAGRSASQILAHYYQGTELTTGDVDRPVRVLLRSSSSVTFSGASTLVGSSRRLSPSTTYVLKRAGSNTELRSRSGRRLASASGAMRVQAASGGAIRVAGSALNGLSNGSYRGAIELNGSYVINHVLLEDYVRGVISGESPASWPAAALQAQAIAARTYAVTTSKSSVFNHYPDTRSQVYRGVSAETSTTNAAVSATAGKLVTYRGKPIPTYFFSTSGGRTENVENSFLGATPVPYLRSVSDPWDKASPKHSWQKRYRRSTLQKKLGSWSKGTLRSIQIVKRGVSPRVVRADIIGSRGRTTVTGPQLRARLGLDDTWVRFTFVSADTKAPGANEGGAKLASASLTDPVLDGVVASPPGYVLATGRAWPSGGRRVIRLKVKRDGRWYTKYRVRSDADGRWRVLVPAGTRYRVYALGVAGPTIRAKRR